MTEPIQHEFYNDVFSFIPSPSHGWLLPTKEVAAGFGVSEEAIRSQKSRHSDEITQGKHYIKGERPGVAIRNARSEAIEHPNPHWNKPKNHVTKKPTDQTIPRGPGNLQTTAVFWTQRGVIMLGMFIRSERGKAFRSWIEDLVIEENRKAATSTPQDYTEAVRSLLATLEERDTLAQEVIELKPKALIADTIANSEGTHSMAEAAKMLGTGQNRLFKELRGLQILIGRGPNRNNPYQHYIGGGYFRVIATTYMVNGEEFSNSTTRVTPKGLVWLTKKLKQTGE